MMEGLVLVGDFHNGKHSTSVRSGRQHKPQGEAQRNPGFRGLNDFQPAKRAAELDRRR
jgi:hypothetical protein